MLCRAVPGDHPDGGILGTAPGSGPTEAAPGPGQAPSAPAHPHPLASCDSASPAADDPDEGVGVAAGGEKGADEAADVLGDLPICTRKTGGVGSDTATVLEPDDEGDDIGVERDVDADDADDADEMVVVGADPT